MSTVIVVGLAAEAKLARRLGLPVAIGGGSASGAEAAARRAVAGGAGGLISFGLAGGLDPALRPGTVLVPSAVLWRGESFATDTALTAWLGGTTSHCLLGAEAVAANAAAKQRLWQETGAAAVDLETGPVARIAGECRLPFAVLRAVCDPAGRDLPPAALAALDGRGVIGLMRVAGSVAARPAQVPGLLRLAADALAARRALARRVAVIRSSTARPHAS